MTLNENISELTVRLHMEREEGLRRQESIDKMQLNIKKLQVKICMNIFFRSHRSFFVNSHVHYESFE